MNKAEKREIRRVLSGRVEPMEDGRLIALPADDLRVLGVSDGAEATRFFGVIHRARCYETKNGRAKVMKLAQTGMQNIGRGLILLEQPDTLACRVRYMLTPPVVLTFRYERGIPILTAWTGRSLTGRISLGRAIRAFESNLPEELRMSAKKAPKEKKEKQKDGKPEENTAESADSEEDGQGTETEGSANE